MKQKYANIDCKVCEYRKPKKGPRKETINFILSYSKALKVENLGWLKIETILN